MTKFIRVKGLSKENKDMYANSKSMDILLSVRYVSNISSDGDNFYRCYDEDKNDLGDWFKDRFIIYRARVIK